MLLYFDVVGTTREAFKDNFGTLTRSTNIICARFICTIILHLSQQDEVKQGLDLMKYAVNHRYFFLSYQKAFLMGFLQSFMTVSVESVNMLVILQSETTQDIVFNFIAVAVISDFDNFVFNSLRNEPLKELVKEDNVERFMPISFTTSPKSKPFSHGGQPSDVMDENGEPMPIKIRYWSDRTCCNRMLFSIYRVFRIFFVSIYFYFFPPISIFLTFQLPFYFRGAYK